MSTDPEGPAFSLKFQDSNCSSVTVLTGVLEHQFFLGERVERGRLLDNGRLTKGQGRVVTSKYSQLVLKWSCRSKCACSGVSGTHSLFTVGAVLDDRAMPPSGQAEEDAKQRSES